MKIPRGKRAQASAGKKTTRKTRKRKRKELDVSKLADQIMNDIAEYLGFETIGIPEKVQRIIVHEIMNVIITSTSYKPSLNTLLKRINRKRDLIYMIIARKLLENISLKKMGDQQLEFIVYNGGKMIIDYIPSLYRELKNRGRENLISYLRYVWEKYGRPTPVECPKCGFRAVMPDYSCYVCGHVVSEKYIREKLAFDEKFKQYIKNASVAELRDVVEIGYVLLGENEVKSPRSRRDERDIYYPVYLRKKDIQLLNEEVVSRKIPV